MRRIVDLSMPVHMDMLTFPRVPPPAMCVYESHTEFAERIGAAAHGVDSLTASYLVVHNDHVGTHLDAQVRRARRWRTDTIPLEYCILDGVLLTSPTGSRRRHQQPTSRPRSADRIRAQERDIVLIHTGAAPNTEERYRTDLRA